MKRSVLLGILLAVGSLSMAASQAAQPAGPRVIDIQKLKDNLYVLTSSTPGNAATFSGGNVAVFITDAGVTLVDTKLAGWGQAVLDKVKSVTNKPITTIINTHTHGDHTGNDGFFGTTVEIVAQENTKTNMEKMDAFKGDNAKFLPKKTYKDKLTLGSGKDRIDLYYFGRGHTNGDAWIVFPELRVAHAGDIFSGKNLPLLDMNNGGSGIEIGDSLARAHAGIKNVDTIITGHSTLMPWADLAEYAQFNKDFLASVRAAAMGGQGADAVAGTWKVADKYKGYTIQEARLKTNVQSLYRELGK